MQEPLFLVRNNAADWQRLYQFFVLAEENQEIVTSVTIQQVFPPTETGKVADLNTVRWYMYHYWRWFLFCVDDTVKPYEYRCKRIKGYPQDYFIQAHTHSNHMKYFAHFVRSIEADKESRKAAQGRGTPRKPRSSEVPVQLPLGIDDIDGRQQEEESFEDIPVDTHLEEEEPLQVPDFLIDEEELLARTEGGAARTDPVAREQQKEEAPAPLLDHTISGKDEYDAAVAGPDHEREDTREEPIKTDEHTPPPVMPPPLSDTRRSRISPVLVASLIVGTCVVVGLVLYFISRQR